MSILPEQLKEMRELSESFKGLRFSEVMGQAVDTIEALSAKLEERNSGWIPCSERLPEENEGALVQVNGEFKNFIFVNAFDFATYDKEKGWIIEAYPEWENPNVIAWQPLPERYREEEEVAIEKKNSNNCRVIKRMGDPGKDTNGKCMGFGMAEDDDEPCKPCKRCKCCTSYEEDEE